MHEDNVTPDLLAPMVEQPEPSTGGDWYIVDLRDLLARGYTHVEFHFPFSDDGRVSTNAARLAKDPDPDGAS
jgi:hypothetical protein